MSTSCVGTCSHCGEQRFWLSDTLSLQLDDGRLICLPHPAESGECETHGLTLGQASDRGRLYRESFYVCRHCGRTGETIEKQVARAWDPITFDVREAFKWGWGSAAIVVPFLAWMRWWQAVTVVGGTLLGAPLIGWWDNRKLAKRFPAPKLPRPDAPGRSPISPPAAGCDPTTVIGGPVPSPARQPRATGPCCDNPDWIPASSVIDEDRIPCPACGQDVMTVSEHAIH
jgi:hypothetical protein